MIKCMGICSVCGRCKNSAMMSGANDRKTKMTAYPADFVPDTLTERADDGSAKTSGACLGVAFDIGTTTVVGMMWDLAEGKQIATCARTNPQNEFGMDVISRIDFCGKNEGGLDLLRSKITDCLNEIIGALCEEQSAHRQDIRKVSVCGNTTMSHLFAGYPPESLARAPFDPAYTGALRMTPEEAHLEICQEGVVWVTPNIAGHVGGDITTGLVASRLLDKTDVTLFIDIGTNGEIVLTDGKKTLACSTAAGPAFEGACIKHGMRAAEGAIEKVMIQDGEVFIKTIGDHEPQGICGSGLIDAIAQMLGNKLINKKGRLACAADVEKLGLDEAFRELLVDVDGERAFLLAEKEDGSFIMVTQNDIREVQLAKGAISAGITMMLAELGHDISHISEVIVAGAFGNYIDKENAVRIGLLPDVELERIISAGNTAGAGASMVLASGAEQTLADEIPQRVKHVELADDADFQKVYIRAMGFAG